MEHTTISSDGLTVDVATVGAELVSVRNSSGVELLWDAGPQWARHAPLLFPCIGKSPDDSITVDDATYPMPQHGFARDLPFRRIEHSAGTVTFELLSDDTTRKHYPFDFVLTAIHSAIGTSLTSVYTVTNTGSQIMPASFGLHTAFRWSAEPGAREQSWVEFEHEQADHVHRIVDGLPIPDAVPSPIVGRKLPLNDEVFADGAFVMERVAGNDATYRSPATGTLGVHWDGFEQFAVWSPPTKAAFVCLEPWAGLPAPAGFTGDLTTKPTQFHLEPGASKTFSFVIRAGQE